jgi:hypothetical protein
MTPTTKLRILIKNGKHFKKSINAQNTKYLLHKDFKVTNNNFDTENT